MKIGPTHAISSKFQQIPTAVETKGPKGDFESQLRRTLRAADSLGTFPPPAGGIFAAAPVAVLQPTVAKARDGLVIQLESVLEDLSVFHARLNAPESEIEAMRPLIEKLAAAQERLTVAAGSLPDDDALKTLLNQALILTSTELIKLRRGDYG